MYRGSAWHVQDEARYRLQSGAPLAEGRSFAQINSRLFTLMGSTYCLATLFMQVRGPYSGVTVLLLDLPSLFRFDFEIWEHEFESASVMHCA